MTKKNIVLIACAVAAISSFLPWASIKTVFGQIDISGTAGSDGQVTLFLAVITGLFCYIGKQAMLVLGMIASGFAALTCCLDIVNISSKGGGAIGVTVGYGLYLCLVGFLVAFVQLLSIHRKASVELKRQRNENTWAPPRRLIEENNATFT